MSAIETHRSNSNFMTMAVAKNFCLIQLSLKNFFHVCMDACALSLEGDMTLYLFLTVQPGSCGIKVKHIFAMNSS